MHITTWKYTKFFALFCSALFIGSVAAAFAAEQAAQQPAARERPAHLRLLAGPGGGQWHTAGERMAEILTRAVVPTTSRTGGGVSNINNVNARNADIAFTLTCFLGAAQSGEREYSHIQADNAALIAAVYPQVLYVLMRKDVADKHGITTMGQLLRLKMPLRFASLKPGTASEAILNMLLRYGYGTHFAALKEQGWTLSFNDYAEIADNFVTGELDCFAYTAGTMVPLILTMESHTDVLVLEIEQQALDALSSKFKTYTYTIKPGLYKNVTKPIPTLGDSTCLITRRDLPDDIVYDVTAALWKNKAVLAGAVKDFQAFSAENAVPAGLAVHPGAKKFWEGLHGK